MGPFPSFVSFSREAQFPVLAERKKLASRLYHGRRKSPPLYLSLSRGSVIMFCKSPRGASFRSSRIAFPCRTGFCLRRLLPTKAWRYRLPAAASLGASPLSSAMFFLVILLIAPVTGRETPIFYPLARFVSFPPLRALSIYSYMPIVDHSGCVVRCVTLSSV